MTDPVGGLVLGTIAGALVAFGMWAAFRWYQHDTFDCTVACVGAHSIEYSNTCYCEKTP